MKKFTTTVVLSLTLALTPISAFAYSFTGTTPAAPWYVQIVPSYLDWMRSTPLYLYNAFSFLRPTPTSQNPVSLMAERAKTEMQTQVAWDRLNATISKPTTQIRQSAPVVVPVVVTPPSSQKSTAAWKQEDTDAIQSIINQMQAQIGTSTKPALNCDATHCWSNGGGGSI